MNYSIYRFETLPSTQDFLREKRFSGKDALAVAQIQTQGKGTKGRAYACAEGGLWLSFLHFPQNAPARDAFLMMSRAAVAVCKTLEEYGLRPQIKWANDVLVNGKKVCGILTENLFSGEKIQSTLWGIGLNVNNSLPDELLPFADTLARCAGKTIPLCEVEEKLIKYLFTPFSFSEYASRMAYVGQSVRFNVGEQSFFAKLVGVSENGNLLLERAGETEAYAYGEIAFAKQD